MKVKTIITLSLTGATAIAFMQNMEIIEYKFLFWYLALPKSIYALLFMSLGIGFFYLFRKLFQKKETEFDDQD